VTISYSVLAKKKKGHHAQFSKAYKRSMTWIRWPKMLREGLLRHQWRTNIEVHLQAKKKKNNESLTW